MTKHLLDLHRVDELKNFATDNLLSWCLKSRTGIRTTVSHVLGAAQLLVKYLGAAHQKGELSLQNKSNRVLG